ncbi:hypothetical protein DRW03_10620 [Corallococcus sp. H22C18031201]|nr:hypothetical protein DRW03_10620 [Corallococcus sp. H22C18031201]
MSASKNRPPPDALPPQLVSVLEGLMDRDFAARLERVHRAAAVAIDRLGHLNIVKYEPTSVEPDGADLSLWETMAPAIRDTVVDVNHLVSAIRKDFPPPARAAEAPSSGWAPPPASSDERLAQEVEAVLHTSAEGLARRVSELGIQMRRPEVVSDGWTLMTELAEFRADFRARIGDLVYVTAAAFEDVRREDVVPSYLNQVASRAALRGAAADLRRSLLARLERAAKAEPPSRPALARNVEESLAAFVTLPASVSLRTPYKRRLVEVRGALREAGGQAELGPRALPDVVEPFLALLDEAVEEVTRTWLTGHDRAVWAACGGRLELARMHLALGSHGAARVLAEAVEAAGALYGRAQPFDIFLRKARLDVAEGLDETSSRALVESFGEKLAGLPFS